MKGKHRNRVNGRPTHWEGRTNQRQYTKAGPGRMPFTKTSAPAGAKLWKACPLKRPEWSSTYCVEGHSWGRRIARSAARG